MINAHIFILLAFASVIFLPSSSSASCCYSFNYQPLPSTSPYYKPNNDGPPAYSLSLTASSQTAAESPDQSYLALISFPNNYIISAIPTGCLSVTITSVSCTSSGASQLIADFGNIFIVDGNFNPINPASVAVNGEQCTCQQSCPIYSPTKTIIHSSSYTPTQTSTTSSSATQTNCLPCTTTNSPCVPTTTPTPTTPASSNSSKINTGLIIALASILTILLLLVAICILRRNRKGEMFFFGIKRKGSKIAMSRGSSGNSHNFDNGNIESGHTYAPSETANNTVVVPVGKASMSNTDSSQSTHEQTPSEAAEDAAWGLMNSGYSAGYSSTARPSGNLTAAASVPQRDTGKMGTTLVDIPEVSETSDAYLSEIDLDNDREDLSSANIKVAVDQPRSTNITPDQQPKHTTLDNSKYPTGINSKLQRALSAASSKLAFWTSDPNKEKTRLGRVGSATSATTSSRLFPTGFKITSDPNAPAHLKHTSKNSSPNRSLIASIRPEHHEQQIRQIQLEQDIESEEQSDQEGGDSREMPRYPLVLNPTGKRYSGFDQQSGIGLVNSKDAFVNPGPPPLPPPARSRSNSNNNTKSGSSSNLKRGTHAKTRRNRSSSTAEEHAAKSEAHNPGLYGYM